MKRVIRSKSTKLYLRKDGSWTNNHAEAADFADTQSAMNMQRQYRLNGVEIVLQMGLAPNPQYDVVLPLTDAG